MILNNCDRKKVKNRKQENQNFVRLLKGFLNQSKNENCKNENHYKKKKSIE